LIWASEGRQRDEWDRFSLLLAMTHNANIDPKKTKPAKPSQFNPFAEPEKPAQDAPVGIEILRHIFVPDSLPQNQPQGKLVGGGAVSIADSGIPIPVRDGA